MKNLDGVKWNELTAEQQKELLIFANAVDGETGNNMNKDGDCIIDLNETYSIIGKTINGEIVIDGNAKIYNPAK